MIHSHAFLQMHSFKTKSKQADASYSLLPLLCLKYTPLNYSWIRVTTKFISTWVKIDSSKIECVLRRFIFNFARCRHTFHLFFFSYFFFLLSFFQCCRGNMCQILFLPMRESNKALLYCLFILPLKR